MEQCASATDLRQFRKTVYDAVRAVVGLVPQSELCTDPHGQEPPLLISCQGTARWVVQVGKDRGKPVISAVDFVDAGRPAIRVSLSESFASNTTSSEENLLRMKENLPCLLAGIQKFFPGAAPSIRLLRKILT